MGSPVRMGWITLAVLAVCGVCGIVAISRFTGESTPERDPAGNQAPRPAPGIGAPVRDGTLELTVRNVGDTPQSFYNTNQEAHSADGTRFEPDWEATYDARGGDPTADEAIKPGHGIDAIVVYDIPKDAKIQTLTLHDSGLSNGVVIRIA